jgi:carbon-monoxide dehydrogenase small subunit
MAERVDANITVNGRTYRRRVEARMHLADFLRHELGLTGTHIGCEQGICGNCTVLVDGQAIKSCLMFAAQADGREVATVESLASEDELHPLQQVFKEEHGLQCGYCTPGFLMTATALAAEGRRLSRDEVREELAGVVCRCTGYRNVVTAVERYLAETADGDAGRIDD